MIQDFRFALRMIGSHRWFSLAVVATIAFGIGLNTMVFTLLNAVLFKPIAVKGGERLVIIYQRNVKRNFGAGISYPDFREYRAQTSSFERLEAGTGDQGVLSEQTNPPQAFQMMRLSSGIFEMLGTPPILGRGFNAADDKPGAEAVVLLGYAAWKDRYGSSPNVVGRHVRLNSQSATIIGVMPEGFKFPANAEIWTALAPTAENEKRSNKNLDLYAVMKPGVTIAKAQADMEVTATRLAASFPETNKDLQPRVETFQQRFNGDQIRLVFSLMQTAVGFVLLIACANVANMLFSRGMERRRELSIRAAMGASRWQIVRQLLMESVMLSVLGGLLGFGLAKYGVNLFDLATRDVGKPYWVAFEMNYVVFLFFAVLCIATGLLFGLAPALRATRIDLNSALKEGTRAAGSHRGGRLGGALVVAQFALTLVLLTGAGVFVKGAIDGQNLNKNVPADRLLGARVRLTKDRYADNEARWRFFQQLIPRLQAIPGVMNVALSSNLPGLGSGTRGIEIEGKPNTDPAHAPQATYMVNAPGYFAAIDLPILSGRDFNEEDGTAGRKCAIVSREFADRFWPRQDAVGKRFRLAFGPGDKATEYMTVIGTTANMVQRSNEPGVEPIMFVPYRQEDYQGMALLLRSSGATAPESAMRAAVQSLDQDLPLFQVSTLVAAIERQQWFLRLFGMLFSTFAFIALVIASVGLYAVIAQATARRTQEIGVRMALGARPSNILMMVLSRGAIQLAIGLALGLAASIPAARVMSGLPFKAATKDPLLFATVSAILVTVGIFASYLPARRAAALEPVVALRDE